LRVIPKAIPEGIIKKAIQHAEERKAQGLSPFYQDGEEKRTALRSGGYVIQRGDTLSGIAQETGFSVEELKKLNKIENIDKDLCW
jgi:choline kinase